MYAEYVRKVEISGEMYAKRYVEVEGFHDNGLDYFYVTEKDFQAPYAGLHFSEEEAIKAMKEKYGCLFNQREMYVYEFIEESNIDWSQYL